MLDAQQPFADGLVAGLYDAFPFEADVPFYLRLAHETGGRVVEVACGTGRLVVPLTVAGCHVVGVDASAPMLALARDKLAALGLDSLDGRVRLVQADMRSFHLPEEFDLAIIAVRSFGYLLSPGDQAAALGNIAGHLRPGGMLVLDLAHPLPAWLLEPPGSLRQDLCEQLDDGTVVTRTETVVATDLASQIRTTRAAYEVVQPDGRVTKRTVQWSSRYTYRFEAEHLLERAGFAVEALYGGYCGEPFTSESRTMLFVARRGEP